MRSSLKTTRKSFSTGEPTTCLLVRTSISPLSSTNLTGKIVKAWHIENSKGEKSPNLATRAGGKHIDLVVGKACRSTAHFISRFYPAMYDETLNGMDSFK